MICLLVLLHLALPSRFLKDLDPKKTEPMTVTLLLIGADGRARPGIPMLVKPHRAAVIMDGPTYKGYYFQFNVGTTDVVKVGCIVPAPTRPEFTRKNQRYVIVGEPEFDDEGYADFPCRREQPPMT